MTAGLAVGARQVGDACSEKCLQVTGAHGVGESKEEGSRGRAVGQGTQKSGLNASCWSVWLSQEEAEAKEEKSLCICQKKKKKAEEEGDTVHDQQGPQFSSCSRVLSISPW